MLAPRPRSTRQALAGQEFAIGRVARPNPIVIGWRWRYELASAVGLSAGTILLTRSVGVGWVITGASTLVALIAQLPALRHWVVAHAWCVITPHRVRTGCAHAWIHSRRGKIPVVLRTTAEPFGERVHLWCRAGTSAEDFVRARHLITAACWARDVRVTCNERYVHLIVLDVIRHIEGDLPDDSRRDCWPGEPEMPEAHSPVSGDQGPPTESAAPDETRRVA